jgi:hypothetical protein
VESDEDAMGMSRTSDDIESIEETLAILSDRVAMEQIRESERALAAGEVGSSLTDLQEQLDVQAGRTRAGDAGD